MNFTQFNFTSMIKFFKDNDVRIVNPRFSINAYPVEQDFKYIFDSKFPTFDIDYTNKYNIGIDGDFQILIGIDNTKTSIHILFMSPRIGKLELADLCKNKTGNSEIKYTTKLFSNSDYRISYDLVITFVKINSYTLIIDSMYYEIPQTDGNIIIEQFYAYKRQISTDVV